MGDLTIRTNEILDLNENSSDEPWFSITSTESYDSDMEDLTEPDWLSDFYTSPEVDRIFPEEDYMDVEENPPKKKRRIEGAGVIQK